MILTKSRVIKMTQHSLALKITVAAMALFLVPACVRTTESRGYTLEQADFDTIKVSQSHKDDVLNALGSPSSRSLFGKETWYYMAAKTESIAFLKPRTKEQHVIAVTFDEADKVSAINNYDLKDAKRIEFAKDATETEGNKTGIVKQLLGNVGRFNPDGATPRTTPRNINH